MRVNKRGLLSAAAIMLVLLIPSAAWAQHKHTQSAPQKPGMAGMKSEMSKMMQSPHHKLMAAYMKSMSEFARTLRDQAVKPTALDVDFARATVAELRHNLDAIEALRQKHMQTMSAEMKAQMEAMSAEMKSKMQMMMEKMDKDRAKLKDQVSALETDVQADRPNSEQVTAHTNALLKQLGMMKMGGGSKAGKKKMEMKKKPEMNVSVRFQPTVRELHLEKLWDRNIAIATRLVNTVTTPMLLKVVRSGKLQPSQLVTHRFALSDVMKAYDTFGNAAQEGALKVVLTNSGTR